ncbi:hypothetical protein LTR37_006914 [Vermiconidia calcicola]|uniref:Uncharacterized protein n=1 Tax=Vermiconidia calcicola TaxID=1690605 RepID=A0ACC3NF42_9PEZI|nr:hypothetical protein LTR37_006914 [Vermiconidia calcicola]
MASSSSDPEGRPAKRTKLDYLEDITVLVGPDEKRYVVHKNLVCDNSSFFRAACNGDWKETKEKVVRLPEVDPDIFANYLGWIYTGELDVRDASSVASAPKYHDNMPVKEQTVLEIRTVDTYAFGDMVQDVRFCNTVVDELKRLVEDTKSIPAMSSVEHLYERVHRKSGFMRLWVDYYAFDHKPDQFAREEAGLPASFVFDIAHACIKRQGTPLASQKPFNRPKCFYHKHIDDSDKCV